MHVKKKILGGKVEGLQTLGKPAVRRKDGIYDLAIDDSYFLQCIGPGSLKNFVMAITAFQSYLTRNAKYVSMPQRVIKSDICLLSSKMHCYLPFYNITTIA